MNAAIRHIVSRTYKPLLEKYLSRTRVYTFEGLRLVIPPQVFHPRFFFSTRLLLQQVRKLELSNKTLLEPGCGSGLISLIAARAGAHVTSTDINSIATETLRLNAHKNKISLSVIESDLFDDIPQHPFDIIAINPPYYKRDPFNLQEFAWCCGVNGEYFEKLFRQLRSYTHNDSIVHMVLYEGCDMQMIKEFANANSFRMKCIYSKNNLLEKNFIFKIERG
jgi:release factor glutamine methyltransferase